MPTHEVSVSTETEAREYINRLHGENEVFYSDDRGRGALNSLQQTFQKWHYVAELLQNAIDERARRIRVVVNGETLTFEHDGNAFAAKNVRGLCTKGVSSKGAATVGFMGIGFKAVFHSFVRAGISSGPWRFKLEVRREPKKRYGDEQIDWLGCVLPEWDSTLPPPSDGMTCRFTFSGRCRKDAVGEDLDRILGKDHRLLALLAWRHVSEVEWAGRRWLLSQEAAELADGCRRVLLIATDAATAERWSWILFDRQYQPSRLAIRQFLEHRQISPKPAEEDAVYAQAERVRQVAVFCELRAGRPVPPQRGSVFSLLPTGVSLPLGVHVQADWLLDTSRQELIQRDDNAWHDEIRAQIPRLLRRALEWVIGLAEAGVVDWHEGYGVLPGDRRAEQRHDPWLDHESFQASLAAELREFSFLPVPAADGSVEFCTPDEARHLPDPLAKAFDEDLTEQRRLFGSQVVSLQLLSQRAFKALVRLDLCFELSADELAAFWNGGQAVADWLSAQPAEERQRRLDRLLKALVDVEEEDEEWADATLDCLPTETGVWTNRKALNRFPSEWDSVRGDARVRKGLSPHVGPGKQLLEWRFDSYLRKEGEGKEYVAGVAPEKLEEVAARWWATIPERTTPEQAELVMHFTNWVRKKMPQRQKLILKVFCRERGRPKKLLPVDNAVVADPYGGDYRRRLFADLPAVVQEYLNEDEDATPADWLSFFTQVGAKGGFFLSRTVEILSYHVLRAKVGGTYLPPPLRSTPISGTSWSNVGYQFHNLSLPDFIGEPLEKGSWTVDNFKNFCPWLGEVAAKFFQTHGFSSINYYPPRQQTKYVDETPCRSRWWRQLSDSRWVYDIAGQGPYRLAETLRPGTTAGDGSPVADLTPILATTLESAGFEFRKPLADALPVERLSVLGSSADEVQLAALLDAAIEQAVGSEDAANQLAVALEQPLFPGGARRYPYSQLVQRIRLGTARGTPLAGFLLAADELDDSLQNSLQRLQEIDQVRPIPAAVDGCQIVRFLADVWQRAEASPQRLSDEDAVKQVMPQAYRYLLEDLAEESETTDEDEEAEAPVRVAWDAIKPLARVFTTGGGWVRVTEAVFDDLGDDDLRRERPKLPWATGGYLGTTLSQQQKVAQEIGLRLLSNVVTRFAQPGPAVDTADASSWADRFALVAAALSRLKTPESRPEVGSPDAAVVEVCLQVVDSLTIRTEWLDAQVPPSEASVRAFLQRGGGDGSFSLYVSGEPQDFALAATDLLVNRARFWDLRDPLLATRIGLLLSFLGEEVLFRRALEELCKQFQIDVPVPPAPEIQDEQDESEGDEPGEAGGDRGEENEDSEDEAEEDGENDDEDADTRDGGGGPAPGTRRGRRGSGNGRPGGATGGGRGTGGGSGTGGTNTSGGSSTGTGWIPWAFVGPRSGDSSPRERRDDGRGRDAVLRFEAANGRLATVMDRLQEGYDIQSLDSTSGITRRIEVKGISEWLHCPVYVTRAQFRHGSAEPPEKVEYWLYVVDRVNSDRPRVVAIRTAVQRVERFYFQADTWQDLADETGAVELPLPPVTGDDPVPPVDGAPVGEESE